MDGYGYMDGMLQDIPGWRGGGLAMQPIPGWLRYRDLALYLCMVHPRKLTWQWEILHLKMYFLFKMGIFQCHVSFQGCSCKDAVWCLTLLGSQLRRSPPGMYMYIKPWWIIGWSTNLNRLTGFVFNRQQYFFVLLHILQVSLIRIDMDIYIYIQNAVMMLQDVFLLMKTSG